jgi:ankyrin repeat protein
LILAGTDINAKDVDGNTPSHCCSEYGHIDCLRFLLLQNPSLFSKNKDGHSPLDVAVNNEILEVSFLHANLFGLDIPRLHKVGQENAKNVTEIRLYLYSRGRQTFRPVECEFRRVSVKN